MKINNIIWSEVNLEHIDPLTKGKYITKLENCAIKVAECLHITEYSSAQGVSTGKGIILGSPKLIVLTPWGMEFEAEYVTVKLSTKLKKEKTLKHKVKVTVRL